MWSLSTLLGIIVPLANLAYSDVVLVQWGRRDCEGRGAELVYSGLMAGPSKTAGVKSSANKHLCLPNNPTHGRFDPGKQNRYSQIFRVEYQVDRRSDILSASRAKYDGVEESKDFNGNAVPCAVCLFFRTTTKLVVPGKFNCPYNWRTAYSGYLMASVPSNGGRGDSYYPYRKKRQSDFGESADPPPGMGDPIPTPALPNFPPGSAPLGGGGGGGGGGGDRPLNGGNPPSGGVNLPPTGGNQPSGGGGGPIPPPAFNPQQGQQPRPPLPGFFPSLVAGNGQGGVPLGQSGFPAASSGPPTTARPLDPRFVQMCGTWYDYWASMQKMYQFTSYPSYPSYPSYQSYPNYGAPVPDYNPGVGTAPDYNPGTDYNAGFTGDGGTAAGIPGDAGFSDIGYSTDVGSASRIGRQATWNPQPRQQPGFRQVATTVPMDDREKFIQSCATYYEAAEKMKKLFEANNPGGSTFPSRPAQAEQNEGFDDDLPRVETSRQQPLKTDYVCIAGSPDVHALGKQNAGIAAKITPVEANCNDLPCPSYREGREIQCVVCVR